MILDSYPNSHSFPHEHEADCDFFNYPVIFVVVVLIVLLYILSLVYSPVHISIVEDASLNEQLTLTNAQL